MANRTRLRPPYDTSEDNDNTSFPPPRRQNGRPPPEYANRQQEYNSRPPEFNNRYSSPRTEPQPSRGPSRLDILEERIAQQEKNAQALIERAFKTKEDVIESLNFTHGTWQEEKHARSMLQEHIRTITAVVNRLNNDIANLEGQIQQRDTATVGTNAAVKNLEVHHVATLTDLRGRIVRCDTSIGKLSSDIRQCMEAVKQTGGMQQDSQNRLVDRIHNLESKLVSVTGQLERVAGEQKMKLTHLEGDTGQQLAQLDARTRQVIDDLKQNIQMYQSHADVEREKLEGKLLTILDEHNNAQAQNMEKMSQRIEEQNYSMEEKMRKLEDMIVGESHRLSEMLQNLESKVVTRLEVAIRGQGDEIAKVKRDTRDGFSTVHESISNMKTVMEGKRKLLEDQLRKEISQIRKMVVLV